MVPKSYILYDNLKLLWPQSVLCVIILSEAIIIFQVLLPGECISFGVVKHKLLKIATHFLFIIFSFCRK